MPWLSKREKIKPCFGANESNDQSGKAERLSGRGFSDRPFRLPFESEARSGRYVGFVGHRVVSRGRARDFWLPSHTGRGAGYLGRRRRDPDSRVERHPLRCLGRRSETSPGSKKLPYQPLWSGPPPACWAGSPKTWKLRRFPRSE